MVWLPHHYPASGIQSRISHHYFFSSRQQWNVLFTFLQNKLKEGTSTRWSQMKLLWRCPCLSSFSLTVQTLRTQGEKALGCSAPVSSLKPDCSVDSLRTSTKACNWSSGVPAIYLSLLGLKWRLCKWRTKVDGVEWRLFYTSSIVFTFPFAKSAVSS